MRKKPIKDLAPGDIFTYTKERFVVLENLESGVFCLTADLVGSSPFQRESTDDMNNYDKSTLKDNVELFVEKLIQNGASELDFIPFKVDLRPTDMSAGYGTITVKAAPLTLWQYGKYKDLIPFVDYWWWLVTPLRTRWLRSPLTSYAAYAWNVFTSGYYDNSYCTGTYGVRPALKLSSLLLVSVEGEGEDDAEECDNCTVDLSRVGVVDLANELARRLEAMVAGVANEEEADE